MANNPKLKRGPGRPKGALNKASKLLKDAILEAAALAGDKGDGKPDIVNYLRRMAKMEPGAFMPLLGKVLPTQVTGADDGPVKLEHQHKEAAEFVRSRLAQLRERRAADQDPGQVDSTGTSGPQVVVEFPGKKGST